MGSFSLGELESRAFQAEPEPTHSSKHRFPELTLLSSLPNCTGNKEMSAAQYGPELIPVQISLTFVLSFWEVKPRVFLLLGAVERV